ncbi:MAG: hypothetical protein JW874_00650 [Spirochaetales bacterium]|nr:hypothetical protein [Spirochaetales bacterium]
MSIETVLRLTKIILVCIILGTSINVFGQTVLTYSSKTGKETEQTRVIINQKENGFEVETDQETALCNKNFTTISYRYVIQDENTDFNAVRENDQIRITGLIKGKITDKVLHLEPSIPWFQLIFLLGPVPCLLNRGDVFTFYSLNPKDLSLVKMCGFIKKENDSVEVNGKTVSVVHTKITIKGISQILWSADYWLREDGRLLRNHIRQGVLAPLTVRQLIKEEE